MELGTGFEPAVTRVRAWALDYRAPEQESGPSDWTCTSGRPLPKRKLYCLSYTRISGGSSGLLSRRLSVKSRLLYK